MTGSCTIHLYQSEPDAIGKAWPQIISEAVAIGNKVVRLKPGDEEADHRVLSSGTGSHPRADLGERECQEALNDSDQAWRVFRG